MVNKLKSMKRSVPAVMHDPVPMWEDRKTIRRDDYSISKNGTREVLVNTNVQRDEEAKESHC